MSTRANWFIADPSSTEEIGPDPWAVPIEEVGQRVDLRDPRAALELRLAELLHREGNLDAKGLVCPIKDRADTTCHACPVSCAHDPTEALAALCRIGREQEVVLTELAVLRCRDCDPQSPVAR